MDPQQELFTKIKLEAESLGYAVHDGFLPPEGTPYPFVYLGDFRQIDAANKSAVFGTVSATIHVWSDSPKSRGTVSQMLLALKIMGRRIEHTANFTWALHDVAQRILPDNTTKTPLLHGVLEVEYKFS